MKDQDTKRAELRDTIEDAEANERTLRTKAAAEQRRANYARVQLDALEKAEDEETVRTIGATMVLPGERQASPCKTARVRSVSVVTPSGSPEQIRVMVALIDGRAASLTLTLVDAYKLERRLAWKLDGHTPIQPKPRRPKA